MSIRGVPLLAAFSFGFMMAISPCTLVTSLTAALYLSRDPSDHYQTMILSGFYILGRMVTYAGLACFILVFSLNSTGIVSFFRQYGERLLSPVLILIGIWMLDLFPVHTSLHHGIRSRVQAKVSGLVTRGSFSGSFLLGMFFALSFCPIGIVFYFGMLIPLAYRMGDPVGIPTVFAIATTLPTIGVSMILTTGMGSLGSMLPALQKANVWMQRVVGIVFLVAGIYYLPRLLGI